MVLQRTSDVSYQLPAELRTKKLDSLPEKEQAIAEELIASKFGVGEIMSEGRYENRDRIQDPFSLPNNLLQITVFFNRGYQYRLHLPLSASILSNEQQENLRWYSESSAYDDRKANIAYETVRRVEHELKRYLSTSDGRTRGGIKHIEVEFNGFRAVINSLEDIGKIIYERLV